MAEGSYFACVFGKVGLVPDSGVSWELVRRLGYRRGLEAALSGRRVTADEALQLGLVNRVVVADELAPQAGAWAAELAAGPIEAWALTKRQFRAALHESPAALLDLEAVHQTIAGASEYHVAARAAFITK
jgi:2-(1,2-epoxy-1,2-dihydrophenyl)acetyl-CoA isomerase